MGKVAKPLTIVVFSPLGEWPEIVKLEKQGHTIVEPLAGGPVALRESTGAVVCQLLSEADIILGPRCWYMTELHRKHLVQAIKQARLRRYGTISKQKDKKDGQEKDLRE
ncbi:hypothetical protein LCGC14_2702090 [marine sediment metagenome]|uniref:Uncharacterized protein n=1 Tax=marine sediment metagenome TaxID=412755 RepID=A0A0F9C7D2_9ZZZZ